MMMIIIMIAMIGLYQEIGCESVEWLHLAPDDKSIGLSCERRNKYSD
jgi:hypothetical protein